MAAIRIRGTWKLTLTAYNSAEDLAPTQLGIAELEIRSANRAGLTGVLKIEHSSIAVGGRVKPGSPAIVTIYETSDDGGELENGTEIILYIPPWWPQIDYKYDYIMGTMVIAQSTALDCDKSRVGKLISISGILPFD